MRIISRYAPGREGRHSLLKWEYESREDATVIGLQLSLGKFWWMSRVWLFRVDPTDFGQAK